VAFFCLAVVVSGRLIYEDTETDSDEDLSPTVGNDCLTPQCGGFVAGVVQSGAADNCSFWQLDLESGATHILTSMDVCKDHRNGQASASAVTAYDNPSKSILFANGNGNNIYKIAVGTGKATELATLPAQYDHLLGLAVAFGMGATGQWYLVTDTTLYVIQSGVSSPIFDVSDLGLSTQTRVEGYNDTIYLVDGLKFHSVDLLNLKSSTVTIQTAGLATATTLDYWTTHDTLTMIDSSRNVYSVNPTTGAASLVMQLPAGQGVVQRSALFGDMYFPCDDTSMMVSNLAVGQGEGPDPFPGAGTQGNFQYYY